LEKRHGSDSQHAASGLLLDGSGNVVLSGYVFTNQGVFFIRGGERHCHFGTTFQWIKLGSGRQRAGESLCSRSSDGSFQLL
jgi:hypothetical protein